MKFVSILGAAISTVSAIAAQSVYSPPGIGSTEDGSYSYYFGRYADMRHMMVDGEHGTAGVYKSLALRLDNRSHTSSTTQGRSWTEVTIDLSLGDFDTFSQTFSANVTSTPTRVFSGSVTWVAQTGYPTNTPATWGGSGASFPFGTGGTSPTYLHTSGDILIDTNFSGGVMANGATFSGSTGFNYYHDGPGSATSSAAGAGRYVPATRLNRTATTPCNDSAMTTTTGAYTYGSATAYGGYYSILNYRNTLSWYTYSYYCGYENPVIHGIGLSTLEPGIDMNTGCNLFHVGNFVTSYVMLTMPAAANTSGYTGYAEIRIPHDSAYVGLVLTTQGAFADSVDGTFKLTQAYERAIPPLQPKVPARRIATYHYTPTSATGTLTPSTSATYNPSLCWGQ